MKPPKGPTTKTNTRKWNYLGNQEEEELSPEMREKVERYQFGFIFLWE